MDCAVAVAVVGRGGVGEVEAPVVAAHQGAAARGIYEGAGAEEGEAEAVAEGVGGDVLDRGEGVQVVRHVGLMCGRPHDGEQGGAGCGGSAPGPGGGAGGSARI